MKESLWLSEALVRKVILPMHTRARTLSRNWVEMTGSACSVAQCCLDKGPAHAVHCAWYMRKDMVYYSENQRGNICYKGHHGPLSFPSAPQRLPTKAFGQDTSHGREWHRQGVPQ